MISDKIKQLQKMKGISNPQMAKQLGITLQGYFNKLSRGHYDVEDLIKILDILDCKLVIVPERDLELSLTVDDIRKK